MKVIGSAFVEFFPSSINQDIEDVRSFRKGIGGSGANIAIAEARLGARTQLISAVGKDPFGRFVLAYLKKERIDCTTVREEEGYKTGISFYEVDRDGRSGYYFYRFPGISMPEERIDLSEVEFENGEIVSLTEAAIRSKRFDVEHLRRTEIFYEPNIRKEFWTEELRKKTMTVVKKSHAVFPNREELYLLTGERNSEKGAKVLLKYADLVVVKLGKDGAELFTKKDHFTVSGLKVKPKSEIGAGDTFHASFISALCDGKEAGEALIQANKAAAFRVATGKFPRKRNIVRGEGFEPTDAFATGPSSLRL